MIVDVDVTIFRFAQTLLQISQCEIYAVNSNNVEMF